MTNSAFPWCFVIIIVIVLGQCLIYYSLYAGNTDNNMYVYRKELESVDNDDIGHSTDNAVYGYYKLDTEDEMKAITEAATEPLLEPRQVTNKTRLDSDLTDNTAAVVGNVSMPDMNDSINANSDVNERESLDGDDIGYTNANSDTKEHIQTASVGKKETRMINKTTEYKRTFNTVKHRDPDQTLQYRSGHVKKKYRIVWFQLRAGYYKTMKEKVDMDRCSYRDCSMDFIMPNRKNQAYDLSILVNADAVVFQGNQIMAKHPPKRKNPSQVFIFFDMESPPYIHYTRYKAPQWTGVFNWTMTYRQDSDFFNPYGIPIKNPEYTPMPQSYYSNIFKKKTKTALWLVSHCGTQSKREEYVKKLSKYIDVDIFGYCGTMLNYCYKSNKDCLPKLVKTYKFYLAFENNLCKDYITEKYHKTLELDIIPVVRGGGDYKSLAVPGTYINTDEFNSVQLLADHLKAIGSSEEMYTSFLKAKSHYVGTRSAYQKSFCEVCKRLRDLDKYSKSYNDIGHWWSNNTCKSVSDIA